MAGRTAGKKKAIAELVDLLPKLDEEGVAFLLEQARVHAHNMEVDRLEKEGVAIARKKTTGGASKRGAAGSVDGAASPDFRVERSDDGETYHLVSGGTWKMFTAGEMAAMVAVVRGAGDEEALARRLHAWFARERRDALSDFSLGAQPDSSSLELLRVLRKTFSGKRAK